MKLLDCWEELEAASMQRKSTGQLRKRIETPSFTDFYLCLEVPSNTRLTYIEFEATNLFNLKEYPLFKSLQVERSQRENNRVSVQIRLSEPLLNDVFDVLLEDIINVVRTVDIQVMEQALITRLNMWAKLMDESIKPKLSTISRRGLAGELFTMLQLEAAGFEINELIKCWTGPEGAHQDFQLPSFAIEVKATTLIKPSTLVISSERELDDVGLNRLYLIVQILDEKKAGTGKSINEIVDSIKSKLKLEFQTQFSRKLMSVGFYGQDESEFLYEIRDTVTHIVNQEFPRIVENQLMNGVGNVQYRLQLSALSTFVVSFPNKKIE